MAVSRKAAKGEVPERSVRLVYAALTGEFGRSLTQSEAVRYLGMKRSTVSDHAKHLERGGFIHRRDGRRTNVLYRKGRNHGIIDCYLEDDMKAVRLVNVQVVAAPADVLPLRMHQSGAWVTVRAVKEGNIEGYPVPSPIGGTIIQSLFGNGGPETGMKGLLQWTGTIIGDAGVYRIRYQKGASTGSMTFSVVPPYVITTSDRCLKAEAEGREPFYGTIAILLMELEKRAGWVFEKDELGNYAIRNSNKSEFGFNRELTEAAKELMGDSFGIPGKSDFWIDYSKTAMGGCGELETRSLPHADALTKLPSLFCRVERLEKGQRIIAEGIEMMKREDDGNE